MWCSKTMNHAATTALSTPSTSTPSIPAATKKVR